MKLDEKIELLFIFLHPSFLAWAGLLIYSWINGFYVATASQWLMKASKWIYMAANVMSLHINVAISLFNRCSRCGSWPIGFITLALQKTDFFIRLIFSASQQSLDGWCWRSEKQRLLYHWRQQLSMVLSGLQGQHSWSLQPLCALRSKTSDFLRQEKIQIIF